MENVFQQKLENFSAAVPAGTFEQIMAERARRRDKGFFFPYKALFSLVLILGATLLVGNYYRSTSPGHNQPAANNSNLLPVVSKKKTVDVEKNVNEEKTVNEEKIIPATVNPTQKKKITTIKEKEIIPSTPVSTPQKNKKQLSTAIDKPIAIAKQVLPVVAQHTVENSDISPINNSLKRMKQLPSLPGISLISPVFDDSKLNLTDKLQALPDECYSFGRQRFYSNYYVDVLYSPNYSLRFLSTKDPEYTGYLKAREKTESYYYAYSAGLRLGLVAESGFALRVGFTFSQLTEIFNHLDKNTSMEITIWEIDPITLDTTGSHTETVPGELYIKHYNTHTSFGLPIYLGYQSDGENVVFSANVGAQYNFQYKTDGRFLGTNLKPANYTVRENDPDKAFKDQIGIELLASFGIGYKITDGMQIVLEPNFRYTLNNISTPANPIEQKYLTMGVWAGLRFKL